MSEWSEERGCISEGQRPRVRVLEAWTLGRTHGDARSSVSRPDRGECGGGGRADRDEPGAAAPVLDAAVREAAAVAWGDLPGVERDRAVRRGGAAGVGGAGTWKLD